MGKVIDNKKNKLSSIFDAAYELFTSKSFNNTSIDDVVKKAGIAKGTFYLYFKDKYDLMDRLVARKSAVMFKEILDRLNTEKAQRKMTFDEQIIFIADKVIDYMEKNREIVLLIEKKFSSCFKALKRAEYSELKESFESLVNENLVNGVSFDETVRQIYIIVDLVGSVCCDAILYSSPFKIDEIKPTLFMSIKKIIR